MIKPPADQRNGLTRRDRMTALEYGLVAAFVVMALIAAIPGLATGLSATAGNLLARLV